MYKTSLIFTASLLVAILFAPDALSKSTIPESDTGTFSFVSMGDGQAQAAIFTTTVNQIATLNPDLVIFNGDLESTGVANAEINPMVTAIKDAGLFNQTFLVRGNHDNVISGSAALWETYFETDPNIKVLPAGVSDYVSLDSNSDYLNYSFIYENSMFVGLDVPGDVSLIPAQLTFLDTRLTYAESIGLVHAFIYFHGPLYCATSKHCTCTTRTDARCTPADLVSEINKHPIISATFHGHEHILGWTHMDNSRVAGLTVSFEQFFTSPSGGSTDNALLYPDRMDYTYLDMGISQGFADITVNGDSFTFSIYKVGTTAPVWSQTFTKGNHPTPTATFTFTPTETETATHTPSPTNTDTPSSTSTPTFTATQTYTATNTFTPTATFTFTPTETETATYTPSPTNTDTPSSTSTPTFTATHTASVTCYALTLSHTGQGSDPVDLPGNSPGCSPGHYVTGQAIQLSGAVPVSGWQIGSWTGTANDSSMASTNSLTMPASAQSVAVNYGQVTIGNWLPIFQGIEEATGHTTVTTGSGNQVIHALRIDLQNPNIHLFTTQPITDNYEAESRETAGLKTSEFLVNNGLQVAINANFFSPCCSQSSGSPMDVEGLAISDGNLVSSQEDADFAAAMLFSSANVPSMIPINWPATSTDGVANAVTGKYPLVVNGTNVASNGPIHPRTAIGYSADKRYLILITLDGRQPGYSDGAEDINTAEWMIRLGAYEAVNLDGGGSTTMVVSDGQGGATLVNRPIHNNIPGSERVVASHLGVYAQPPCHALMLGHTGQGSNPAASPANSTGCSSGQYVAGQAVQLSNAVPVSGWQIDSWTGTANDSSMSSTNSLIMPAATHSAGVNYIETQPTISGNVGVAGATLSYTDGVTTGKATADGFGDYSFAVPYNWSGTVTPSLSSYTFAPVNYVYTNITADQTNQDFMATLTQSLPLVTGWNLISFPLHPTSTAITDVLSSLGSNYDLVYAWDASGGHAGAENWMRYAPGIPGNTLATLDETQGFWIRMTGEDRLEITGTVPTTTNISLSTTASGWNLVGYPSDENRSMPEALTMNGVTGYSLVYAYHANEMDTWKRYATGVPGNDLLELAPAWAYWIKVTSDNTWQVGY
jgi:hypothetical protein